MRRAERRNLIVGETIVVIFDRPGSFSRARAGFWPRLGILPTRSNRRIRHADVKQPVCRDIHLRLLPTVARVREIIVFIVTDFYSLGSPTSVPGRAGGEKLCPEH